MASHPLVGAQHLQRRRVAAPRLPVGDRVTLVAEPARERDLRPLTAQGPQEFARHPLHASAYQAPNNRQDAKDACSASHLLGQGTFTA